ncbi:Dimethyladenosine transferase [Zancudomyces culisetae]|uniref:rRNA adenine N(6)-methyltransferase n=2 Tax=Zancudomyces culisetae TaxID=1213189 RepID=A0A1R1PW09_ZANCU|nr:Dimethyladenosine transferase [Zancudomyces culisetae]|eukprot:OMH85170.1 Dimethyladenosine transferase [Zancudomyces culisetae]
MPKVTTKQVLAVNAPTKLSTTTTSNKKKPYDRSNGGSGNSEDQRHFGPLFNKNLGQHILKNPLVAQTIVDKAEIKPSDIVLEVGPGTGNLTVKILKQAKRVVAVEADVRLAAELTKRVLQNDDNEVVDTKKLEIINGDVIKLAKLPYFDCCISNTPYQISSPLVFKLLFNNSNENGGFRCAVLMFQREFALRLVARPPNDQLYCRLSATVQLYAKVTHVLKISKNNFKPPPKVESSVVKLVPIHPRPQIKFEEWDGLLRICFNRKNKFIRNNFLNKKVLDIMYKNYLTYKSLTNNTGGSGNDNDNSMDQDVVMDVSGIKEIVETVLKNLNYEQARANKLDIDDFLKLLNEFHKHGIHFS